MGLFDKIFGRKKKKGMNEAENKQLQNEATKKTEATEADTEKIKLAIIYYSSTGTNYKLARWAEEGGKSAGADVKILKAPELAPQNAVDSNPAWKAHMEETKDVPEVTMDDLEWADAFVFSTPTRFGNVPSQMKNVLDSAGGLWANGKLVNKVVSAMSSAGNPHGGQEKTILHLYASMAHWGAIIASPGYTDSLLFAAGGNPYGTSVTVDDEGNMQEKVGDAVKHQAKRTVQVAEWTKKGRSDAQ